MFSKHNLIQFPSGRWGFVGRVDVRLGWLNKDGTALDFNQILEISQASNPAMLAKSRSFETYEDALEAAKAIGVEVVNG